MKLPAGGATDSMRSTPSSKLCWQVINIFFLKMEPQPYESWPMTGAQFQWSWNYFQVNLTYNTETECLHLSVTSVVSVERTFHCCFQSQPTEKINKYIDKIHCSYTSLTVIQSARLRGLGSGSFTLQIKLFYYLFFFFKPIFPVTNLSSSTTTRFKRELVWFGERRWSFEVKTLSFACGL